MTSSIERSSYLSSAANTIPLDNNKQYIPETTAYDTEEYISASMERKLQLTLQAEFVKTNVNTSSDGLWNKLHAGIQEIHKNEAIKNEFLIQLIKGEMACSKLYVIYLCNLYSLHKAIENAQARILNKYETCAFIFPTLYRSERLLPDIRLWSFLNATAERFSDVTDREKFLENIQHFVQPCITEFVNHINQIPDPKLVLAIAIIYALYGTILSGGQRVKNGVMDSFIERVKKKIEEYGEPPLEGEDTKLRTEVLQNVMNDPQKLQEYAQQSVSFFSFDPPLNPVEFKLNTWHPALDQMRTQFPSLDEEELIKEAQATIKVVLNSIESLSAFTRSLEKQSPLKEQTQ